MIEFDKMTKVLDTEENLKILYTCKRRKISKNIIRNRLNFNYL